MHSSISGCAPELSAGGFEYDRGSVYDRLRRLTDVRKAKGKRYKLEDVLMIVMLAKLCGADRPLEISDWARNHQREVMQLLGWARPRLPHYNTYRRILAYGVYHEELAALVGEYNRPGQLGEIYALDGKAPRGARRKDEQDGPEYLLSVCEVQGVKVMSQVAVGRKENEIRKAPKALETVEISGKVLTADALHTQRALSALVVGRGGDYVFPVKENQLALYQSIQQLFAPEYPKPGFGKIPTDFLSVQKVNKGHGRLEIRRITTSEMLNAYSTWPGLAQVYRLEREFHWFRSGRLVRTSSQVEFGISSLARPTCSPARLLSIRRAHWGIETKLFYRRDVTFHEDATHMTVGEMGRVMASLNNLVIALIQQARWPNAAQARRYFASHLAQAFSLLTTPFSGLW